jgi:hypothetical protein
MDVQPKVVEVVELEPEQLAQVSGGYHILNDGAAVPDPHVVNDGATPDVHVINYGLTPDPHVVNN